MRVTNHARLYAAAGAVQQWDLHTDHGLRG
jgi:hypothetical protein